MIDINKITEQVEARFNAQAATGIDASFQFLITQDQAFHVKVSQGECQLNMGIDPQADVEFSLAAEVLTAILTGEVNPLQAFMEGQIVAQGDMMLAPVLAQVFAVKG